MQLEEKSIYSYFQLYIYSKFIFIPIIFPNSNQEFYSSLCDNLTFHAE